MAAKAVDRLPLPPSVRSRLAGHSITHCRDLVMLTDVHVAQLADVDRQSAKDILRCAYDTVRPRCLTVAELIKQCAERPPCPTILPDLADLMGDIPNGSITELVGPAGIGKTQWCFSLTASVALNVLESGTRRDSIDGSVVYIDTENKFNAKRWLHIAHARATELGSQGELAPTQLESVAQAVHCMPVTSSAALLKCIDALEEYIVEHDTQMIVLDSIACLVRREFGQDSIAARQDMLTLVAAKLKYLATSFGIPIIVTNQVTTTEWGAALKPALGNTWAHSVNTRLLLHLAPDGTTRCLTIAKSPCAPCATVSFVISTGGIRPGTMPPVLLTSSLDVAVTAASTGSLVPDDLREYHAWMTNVPTADPVPAAASRAPPPAVVDEFGFSALPDDAMAALMAATDAALT